MSKKELAKKALEEYKKALENMMKEREKAKEASKE